MSLSFGESWYFGILLSAYLLESKSLICQKNQDHTKFKGTFLCMLVNKYDEIFICFVKFWARHPVSLNCSQGPEFYDAAFNSS